MDVTDQPRKANGRFGRAKNSRKSEITKLEQSLKAAEEKYATLTLRMAEIKVSLSSRGAADHLLWVGVVWF